MFSLAAIMAWGRNSGKVYPSLKKYTQVENDCEFESHHFQPILFIKSSLQIY